MTTNGEGQHTDVVAPRINIAAALAKMLEDRDVRECLHCELAGRHADVEATAALERLLVRIASDSAGAVSVSSTHDADGIERIRTKVIQRNQLGHGRLKERKDDFVSRALGHSQGIWAKCGMWESEAWE